MTQFDRFNFSDFVRAKIRERYSEFMTRAEYIKFKKWVGK